MGVCDFINGEIVKCFRIPVYNIVSDTISRTGGGDRKFTVGDAVPWKTPYYNFGPDFNVLTVSTNAPLDDADYDFCIHMIRGGKVKDTIKDCCRDADFGCPVTIDGSGYPIRVHSRADVDEYKEAYRSMIDAWEKSSEAVFNLCDKQHKLEVRIDLIHNPEAMNRKWMEAEHERLEAEIDKINAKVPKIVMPFQERWDITPPEDCRRVGEWLDVKNRAELEKQHPNCEDWMIWDGIAKASASALQEMTQQDPTLLSRYEVWKEAVPIDDRR